MKQCGYRLSIVLTVGLVLAFTVPVHAQIFSENFNGYAGTQNNTQSDTGKPVAHSGSVAGWTSTGLNDLHAVSNAPNDWVIMFIQDNVMTLFDGQDANDSGTTYRVEFDYGTAVYGNLNGKTEAADSLLIEVLRTDNSVLASTNVAAGTWGAGNYNLDGGLSASSDYVGDGSGDVRLRLGPTVDGSGNFEGEIALIRDLMAAHRDWGRTRLSEELCRCWNWRLSACGTHRQATRRAA